MQREVHRAKNQNPTVPVGNQIDTLEYKGDQYLRRIMNGFIRDGGLQVSLLAITQGIVFDTEEELIDSFIRLLRYQDKEEFPKYRYFLIGRLNAPEMCTSSVLNSSEKNTLRVISMKSLNL